MRFKRVIEIDANDADTWYFLGTAYVQAKQFPQAIDAFQHALKLNPLHASAEFGLSRAYQQSGDIDHAREHLKKFQYITQNKLGAPMSLAYGEQGQYSRAVESPSAVLKAPAPIKVRFVDVTKEAGLVFNPAPPPVEPIEGFPITWAVVHVSSITTTTVGSTSGREQRRARRHVAISQPRRREV